MKTRTNFGRLILAALGVTLCLADAMSAAERAKDSHAQDHRGGVISGQLTGTFGNRVVYGAGETVTLTPLFPSGGQAITIKTDSEGRFVFQGLPPGQYELKTQLNWTTTYVEVNDHGSSDRLYADHWKQLVARVLVKSGQTAHVTTFSEGETRNAFYAYGGILSKPHHPLVSCD
ncbi:MAG: SpaA isopeptide-forming pilin-related protein [Chthoniobacterales bacterium]